MRKVKIESMVDLESLPEDEWVEAPEGLHAKFLYSVDRENENKKAPSGANQLLA